MKFSKVVCFVAVLVMAFAPMALAQGTYTQIDYPGAVATACTAINKAGDVVGDYYDDGSRVHGFLLSDGVFTTIDVPGAQSTQAFGINDVGQIVGMSDDTDGFDTQGFLYDIVTQTFTTLQYPWDGSRTFAYSINNAGTIVGKVLGPGHPRDVGFELDNGTYTTIHAPGALDTVLTSINNLGEAVVEGISPSGIPSFYLLNQDQLTKLSGSAIMPVSINDAGALTGAYLVQVTPSSAGRVNARNKLPLPPGPHFNLLPDPAPRNQLAGFVKQGNLRTTLRFNHSAATNGYGINNSGTVAGYFVGPGDITHGFIWTPPADATKK